MKVDAQAKPDAEKVLEDAPETVLDADFEQDQDEVETQEGDGDVDSSDKPDESDEFGDDKQQEQASDPALAERLTALESENATLKSSVAALAGDKGVFAGVTTRDQLDDVVIKLEDQLLLVEEWIDEGGYTDEKGNTYDEATLRKWRREIKADLGSGVVKAKARIRSLEAESQEIRKANPKMYQSGTREAAALESVKKEYPILKALPSGEKLAVKLANAELLLARSKPGSSPVRLARTNITAPKTSAPSEEALTIESLAKKFAGINQEK